MWRDGGTTRIVWKCFLARGVRSVDGVGYSRGPEVTAHGGRAREAWSPHRGNVPFAPDSFACPKVARAATPAENKGFYPVTPLFLPIEEISYELSFTCEVIYAFNCRAVITAFHLFRLRKEKRCVQAHKGDNVFEVVYNSLLSADGIF